jgi:8-oxo-dGTP diphosphatase
MKTVTAAIIRHADTVFLARRKTGQKLEGYWEFPGGKLEAGETLQACLEREIFEEFNWKIKAGEMVATSDYVYDHGSIRLIALAAASIAGQPEPTVHDIIAWVPIARLLDYQLAPADIPIAETLMHL